MELSRGEQIELKAMRADEARVANDKLKYPKVTGRTFAPIKKSYTLCGEGFDSGRNDAMRELSSNPLG